MWLPDNDAFAFKSINEASHVLGGCLDLGSKLSHRDFPSIRQNGQRTQSRRTYAMRQSLTNMAPIGGAECLKELNERDGFSGHDQPYGLGSI